jgi:hypothetical protein
VREKLKGQAVEELSFVGSESQNFECQERAALPWDWEMQELRLRATDWEVVQGVEIGSQPEYL